MNQRKASVIFSYLIQAVNVLSALIYTPIMLRILGQSEYGMYQMVGSVVAYLGLLSFGFSVSYVRYYAMHKANGDDEGIARLNGMFLSLFLVLASCVMLCGFYAVVNIRWIFGEGLRHAEYSIARVLMCLMVFNLAVSFVSSVFDCIIISHEEFIFQKGLTLLQSICNPLISLPVLLCGFGSIGMVSVTTALTVGKTITNIWFCRKHLHTQFIFHGFDWAQLKDMWKFTFFIFMNQIIEQLNLNVDKLLLGRFVGTVSVSIYAVGSQINTLYTQLASSVSDAFIPKINDIVASNDGKKMIDALFIKVGRVQFMVLALVLSGFLLFGKEFIFYWVGKRYEESFYVALLLIIPSTIPLSEGLGVQIQRAKNKHKARSIVYFMIAVLNVGISIPLIQWKGPVGAALGTMFALLFGHGLFMNWYYYKKLDIDIPGFWKRIAKFLPPLCPVILYGIVINRLLPDDCIGVFFFKVFSYTAVYWIFIVCFGLDQRERAMINSVFYRTKERNKQENRDD